MQENFLVTFVEKALEDNGFPNLSEENKKELVPQFVGQLEKRIGASLLPYLDVKKAEEFVKMTQEKTTPEQFMDFWVKNVPEFQEVIKKELALFVEDLKSVK